MGGSSEGVRAPCRHVVMPWLIEWYAEHPELECARCALGMDDRLRARRGPDTDTIDMFKGG